MEDKNWGLSQTDFEALVTELNRGDDRIFKTIFSRLFTKYRNYIRADMQISYDDAADAVTEAFVKIHRFIAEGRVAYGNLEAYTLRIARNEYLMNRRKQQLIPETDIDFDRLDIPDEDYNESTLEGFEKSFNQLGTDCQDLLRLHYYEKIPHRDIGKTLNISEDASKTRMKVCRQRLREIFLQVLAKT